MNQKAHFNTIAEILSPANQVEQTSFSPELKPIPQQISPESAPDPVPNPYPKKPDVSSQLAQVRAKIEQLQSGRQQIFPNPNLDFAPSVTQPQNQAESVNKPASFLDFFARKSQEKVQRQRQFEQKNPKIA